MFINMWLCFMFTFAAVEFGLENTLTLVCYLALKYWTLPSVIPTSPLPAACQTSFTPRTGATVSLGTQWVYLFFVKTGLTGRENICVRLHLCLRLQITCVGTHSFLKYFFFFLLPSCLKGDTEALGQHQPLH